MHGYVNLQNSGEQAGGGVFAIFGTAVAVAAVVVGVVAATPFRAWFQERHEPGLGRQNQRAREYQAEPRGPFFHVLGNAMGDLVLNVDYASPQL